MIRAVSTMPVPVVAITQRASANAITLDQVLPPITPATYTSASGALAWSFFGETTPCRPTTETV